MANSTLTEALMEDWLTNAVVSHFVEQKQRSAMQLSHVVGDQKERSDPDG